MIATLLGPNKQLYRYPGRILVNQDGDYVFGCDGQIGTPTWKCLYKLSRAGQGILSTILVGPNILRGNLTVNIDNGKYLVGSEFSPPYAVLEIADNGSWTYWSDANVFGWDSYHLPQNHRNGYIEGPWNSYVYQLKPGLTGRTTLATLPLPQPFYLCSADFDLQTAASPRFVVLASNGVSQPNVGPNHVYYIDRATFAITSMVKVSNSCAVHYDFAFYRGRHIQTTKISNNKWAIRLSCPRFPGKPYVLVAGVSGVRPGIALPDGRNINLNVDVITIMTLANLLQPYWNPGRLNLDANGEAAGVLDLTTTARPTKGWGMPFWIAMAVLDGAAPGGIAYLPDTYVMRL